MHRLWEISRILITGAIVSYAIILLYFSIFQARLIYYPSREMTANPDDIGLEYEDVFFRSADDLILHGWFVPAGRDKKTLIFCHGNAGNISGRLESLAIFHRLGLNVFMFDYRGYGKSGGKAGEEGTYLDAEAAWKYLLTERNIKANDIIIFGRSLGGAVASHLAQKHNPGALIVESAFTSIKDIGAEMYPYLPVKLLSRFSYDTKEYIRRVSCPVLIIHSRDDEMMPFRHGQSLFEIAEKPKEFLKIAGSHNDGFIVSGEHYTKGIGLFIFNTVP